jgi:glucan 1,3-beta-glucosidase
MLGAWVNANPVDTDKEIDLLIAAANANPDVVSAVIVGNEALLRKEVTGERLAELINKVKSQVKVPVTYADVWEFWLQHPQIAPAVDFLTIHLLPYWEDDPRGIDAALAHVADVRQVFGNRFAPKDILIGETGWPSEGRQRETAVPSRVNEARFIRGFVALAEANGWHYNLIEAFDQPWKRASEGAVGGYWGCTMPTARTRACSKGR